MSTLRPITKTRTLPKGSQLDLSTLPCNFLTGVGPRIAERLTHLGIFCVQDLLFHLPYRYQDRTRLSPIRQLIPGDYAVISGEIAQVSLPRGGRTRLLCRLQDATGFVNLRFFYINYQQKSTLQPGVRMRCFGEVRRGNQGLELIHPEYILLHEEKSTPVEETLTPIYPATDGISQFTLRKLTTQALALLSDGGMLTDILPPNLLPQLQLPTLKHALTFVHRPPPDAPIPLLLAGKHPAQKRLVFEELLAQRLSLLRIKALFQEQSAYPLAAHNTLVSPFLKALPFQLTHAQLKVSTAITHDLTKMQPMLRLVQGDVGSGKTVVAALAILQALENQCQAALLAPTELLAEQHYRNFTQWFDPLQIKTVLLSGQLKKSERQQILAAMQDGSAQVIVGTHAIFQKEVVFAKLALIVVDEQHRFGVEQRARLREKGVNHLLHPHQLIMTATPIPRTLAMSIFADLDYSVIDELPPGRTPVTTSVICNSRRAEVLTRIQQACSTGRQAYWVCTLIEESEVLQCQAAEKTALLLQQALPGLKVALLHGRMKALDKEAIMTGFKKGAIDLLVATTVIEVGVDVPNASLMVIENAERLGLAQLHQLRGRVGRGSVASHCLLLYQAPLSLLAKERLSVMRETSDGFKIAERDLALRGPGEVLGTRQTGDVSLRIANLVRDSELLPDVQHAADILQRNYPELVQQLIQRWIGQRAQYGQV